MQGIAGSDLKNTTKTPRAQTHHVGDLEPLFNFSSRRRHVPRIPVDIERRLENLPAPCHGLFSLLPGKIIHEAEVYSLVRGQSKEFVHH